MEVRNNNVLITIVVFTIITILQIFIKASRTEIYPGVTYPFFAEIGFIKKNTIKSHYNIDIESGRENINKYNYTIKNYGKTRYSPHSLQSIFTLIAGDKKIKLNEKQLFKSMTNISTKRIIINKFWVYPVTKSTFYSQYEPYPEEDIIEISSQLRKNLMYVIKKNKLESQEDLKLLVQWKKGKKLIKSYFISL